ncbi:MAG: peptidoglycan DD-metalloendopeptidase family protein [Ignavibacteriaceae bacterium]|nr:peptidoglycan DD-metalloendopeptidase family protein [Ignavibacteriaceae bacterium]
MKKGNLIVVLLLACSIIITAQEKQIKDKQEELDKLRKEITTLESELKNMSQQEKESSKALENYNKQNFLINKLLNSIKDEERKRELEIIQNEARMKELEYKIDLLKNNYSKYVVAIYKYGKINQYESIINSESFQQAYLRIKYLQKFSEKRQADLSELQQSQLSLIQVREQLEKERGEKIILTKQKLIEEKDLQSKLNEKKKLLSNIRKNKNEVRRELTQKKSAENQIKNLISRLITEGENRKKQEADLMKEATDKYKEQSYNKQGVIVGENINFSTTSFASFNALKGKMNWPISKATVFRKFGENRNEKLNTVTMNYGIDLKASSDLNVKSVAEGVVSAIDYIPGYGSVIIITHSEDYRTVYSHLAEIYVKEGDKVKGGGTIAKVAESLEGHILHFEIWASRNFQNPEIWLTKK